MRHEERYAKILPPRARGAAAHTQLRRGRRRELSIDTMLLMVRRQQLR